MKKLHIITCILLLSFISTFNAEAANKLRYRQVLTGGGTGALDNIDGNRLSDGDSTLVITYEDDATYPSWIFNCLVDADSAQAEQVLTLPYTISPDNNAGDKRHICERIDIATGAGTGTMTSVKENDVAVGGADIVTVDFLGADFDLTESPDTEIQIVINDAGIDHDATTNFAANEHYTQANITATGTIASGVWNGTAIIDAYIADDITVASTSNMSTTGSMGVGTASPGGYHTNANNLVIYEAGGGGITIAGGVTDTGGIYFADGTTNPATWEGYIDYNHSTNIMAFGTLHAERMRIDSAGNVGIGITSPSQLLEIGVANGDGIHVSNTSGAARVTMVLDADGDGQIDLNDSSGNNLIRFNASAAGDSFFNTTGNVGIGTTSPDAMLELESSVSNKPVLNLKNTTEENSTTAAASLRFANTDGDTALEDNDLIGSIWLTGYDTAPSSVFAIKFSADAAWTGATDNPTRIQFFTTADGSSVSSERMRIDNAGYVGIGTISPQDLLHIYHGSSGASAVGTGMIIERDQGSSLNFLAPNGAYVHNIFFGDVADADIGGISYSHNSNNLFFTANATEVMRFQADGDMEIMNGNVGIGTVSPDRIFHIEGTGASADTQTIRITSTDTTLTSGDVVGKIEFESSDAAVAQGIGASITVTGDGTAGENRMMFAVGTQGSQLEVMRLSSGGGTYLAEIAAADSDIAAKGQIWVKTATPNQLWFTDDAGTDVQLGVGGSETNDLETIATSVALNEVFVGTGADTGAYKLMPDCNVAGSALNFENTTQAWSCRSGLGGGSFDSTTVDNTTWSDNANASNIWTFDVSGTDHTMIFGSAIVTFSDEVTVTGNLAVGVATASQALDVVGAIEIEDTTTSTTGVIYKGATAYMHNFHHPSGSTQVPDGYNVFQGLNAGNFTMGSTATQLYHGSYNTGIGDYTLNSVTTGYRNLALGSQSLQNLTTGFVNSAVGSNVLENLTTGTYNVGIGFKALENTNASYNVSIGVSSLRNSVAGSYNVAIGDSAMFSNQSTNENVAVGYYSAYSATGTALMVAVGSNALTSVTTGDQNTGVGAYSLRTTQTGANNVAVGTSSLYSLGNASNNTAVGTQSLRFISTGATNTAIGENSGTYITGGSTQNNTSGTSVYLGAQTRANADGGANEIVIGYQATGNGSNTATIGNGSITDNYFTGNIVIGNASVSEAELEILDGATITTAETDTLSDGSNADSLHVHASAGLSGIVNADLSGTAGITGANLAADTVTYTQIADATQICKGGIWFENPTAADDFESIDRNDTAYDCSITKIWAESDQTVTFMLQIDDGTPADCDSVDLAPAAGEATDTSLDGDCVLGVGEELDLVIASVANTPTWVSIKWTGNWVD